MKISRKDQDYLYVLLKKHILSNKHRISHTLSEQGRVAAIYFTDDILDIKLAYIPWWQDLNFGYVFDKISNEDLTLSRRIHNKLYNSLKECINMKAVKQTIHTKHDKLLSKLGWED